MNVRGITVMGVIGWLVIGLVATAQAESYVSHPPMRPLPVASNRPLEKGPTYFVDTNKGDDKAAGTEQAPWKTLVRGAQDLKAGDTLVLRGGIYYETLDTALSGEEKAPITIRAYPGELVTLDGGFREFFETPDKAWKPYEGGAPGEYRSVKTYAPLRNNFRQPRRLVFALGNFADSMVPLHGYYTVMDLRSDKMGTLEHNQTVSQGMYCGPGIWFDSHPLMERHTGPYYLHVRLQPTTLDYLGKENNYNGETDPRKVPLVVGGPLPVIKLNKAKHIRLQDLVMRGSSDKTLHLAGCENIELDGLTIFGGAPALAFTGTNKLRVLNSAFRGVSAPWSSRYSEKYRGISTYVVSSVTGDDEEARANSNDIEFGYCEFTDCHDGLMLISVQSMKFHHNIVEHFNDDGIELGPKSREDYIYIYNNRVAGNYLTMSLHGGKTPPQPIETVSGSGSYVYRNVFDLRPPVHVSPPDAKGNPGYAPSGVLVTDHGSPLWPQYFFYHNTVISQIPVARNYFLMSLGTLGMAHNERDVFNNIFAQVEGVPAVNFYGMKEPHALREGGNIVWGVAEGPEVKEDVLAKFRKTPTFEASKKVYPDGWTTHDLFVDPKLTYIPLDPRQPVDLRPESDSPAIDSGLPLPSQWPDPQRAQDAGKPDIGALPAGAEAFPVGIYGRYDCFGKLIKK